MSLNATRRIKNFAVAAIGALSLAVGSASAQVNLPPDGKVRFFAGQTSPDLTQFRQEVLDADPDFTTPGGITLYTNITPGQCNGTEGECNLGGSGNIMDFPLTLSQYPGAAVAVGLFLSDTPSCDNQPLRALIGSNDPDITDGTGQAFRDRLDELLVYLRDTNREIYLRIGYEYDGPWNCYNRDLYVQAFRYVKGRIDALGASNIATVWQSATFLLDGDPNFFQDFSNPTHFDDWYPGDAYVDWVGISTFYFQDYNLHQWACLDESIDPITLFDRALTFARNRNKPVFINESTPQAYQNDALTAGCVLTNSVANVSTDGIWNQWYAHYFNYIENNSDVIRAFSYINSDWEAISQFNCAPGSSAGNGDCTDGYWGDSRIQANQTIFDRFKAAVASSTIEGGSGAAPSPAPTPDPAPDPAPTPDPAPDPAPDPDPAPAEATDFGIRFVNDTTFVVFRQDEGWTANFNFLCVDEDCRPGTLNNGFYERTFNGAVLGQTYAIQWKVQDDVLGQVIEDKNVTFMREGMAEPAPAPEPTSNPMPSPSPMPAPSPMPDPDGMAAAGPFGIEFVDDTSFIVFHDDEGWSASFNFLCVDGDCRSGTLTNGRYERAYPGNTGLAPAELGRSYDIEFRVQDDASGQVIVTDTVTFTRP